MTIEELVRNYKALQARKAEVAKAQKAELKTYDETLLALETRIIAALDAAGIDSARTESGTVYFENKTTVSSENADALLSHAMATGEFTLLVVRPRVAAVKEYLEVHGELPPGVGISTERVIRVRK